MLRERFDVVIRTLCQQVLANPTPERLPDAIMAHIEGTFPVDWATLWLTEQKKLAEQQKDQEPRRLRLAAASGKARKLREVKGPGDVKEKAVYEFSEGLTGQIAREMRIINITCPADWGKYDHSCKFDLEMYGRERAGDLCRCVLGVPLVLHPDERDKEGRLVSAPLVVGVLKLENLRPSSSHPEPYFTDADVEVVEAYAAVIAMALEKARMRAESMRTGKGLLEISGKLLVNLGALPNLQAIVEATAQVISAEVCALWLRRGLELRLAAASGYPGTQDPDIIPPYHLVVPPAEPGQPEDSRFKGVGLTVFVANKLQTLNLKDAHEVSSHPAWRGANDRSMWNKEPGGACYSLVAIPLVDKETNDLKGVFKIENKRSTLYQLQSCFTEEDQDLLTTLGNSICLSLIISERLERLRRLETLVGHLRVLDGLDEALFFILTGLTHNGGLQYNRALVFVVDKDKPHELVCRFGVGQIEPDEWREEIKSASSSGVLDIDQAVNVFRHDPKPFMETRLVRTWRWRRIPMGDRDGQVVARHLHTWPMNTGVYRSKDLGALDVLREIAYGDFVLVPFHVEGDLRGVIFADNRFTGNHVNKFECNVLDLFAGMAGALVQAAEVPAILQRERDSAWSTFAALAAHRLTTDANIIDDTLELRLKHHLAKAGAPVLLPAEDSAAIDADVKVIALATQRLRLSALDYRHLSAEPPPPEGLCLTDLLSQTVDRIERQFDKIDIKLDLPAKPVHIESRRQDLDYIFSELLINAWKCTNETFKPRTGDTIPRVRVLVQVRPTAAGIACRVCDSGPGVSAAVRPSLFKREVKDRIGGTGLGLVIIRRMLDRNEARIELIEHGQPEGYPGACFEVTLPIATPVPTLPQHPLVMIVEDNPHQRENLTLLLQRAGYQTVGVGNENAATERFGPDIVAVVADYDLSDSGGATDGGIRLARRLAQQAHRVPFILVSANPDLPFPRRGAPGHQEELNAAGIDAFVDRNDYDRREELIRQLQRCLGEPGKVSS
ncbi:MAG: GAF domain-containing protein [Pseudomonadota bacterium]